jgi:AcrR family transcriptional regulator
MRRLGDELGVEAMSLYNHVANKEDLLNGMVDAVFAEIELPSHSDD